MISLLSGGLPEHPDSYSQKGSYTLAIEVAHDTVLWLVFYAHRLTRRGESKAHPCL